MRHLGRDEARAKAEALAPLDLEADRYCIDIMTQITAIQAALDKIALGLLDGHTRYCMLGEGDGPEQPDEQVNELMGVVGRMLSR